MGTNKPWYEPLPPDPLRDRVRIAVIAAEDMMWHVDSMDKIEHQKLHFMMNSNQLHRDAWLSVLYDLEMVSKKIDILMNDPYYGKQAYYDSLKPVQPVQVEAEPSPPKKRKVEVVVADDDETYETETSESDSTIPTQAPTPKKQKCNYARCTNVYDPNETTREGETLQWMDCMECDGVFTCCSAHGRREMERFVLAHEGKCTNKK